MQPFLILGGVVLRPSILTTTVQPPPVQLEVTVETDNTVTLQADDGLATLNVTSPATYAGDYTVDLSDLETGPVNLVAPSLSGPDSNGVLSATPGLWIYDAAVAAPMLQQQWMQDGSAVAAETGATYTTTAAATDRDISLVETATDDKGSRSTSSATVTLPGIAAPAEVLALADEATRTGNASSFTLSGLSLGSAAPTRDVIVVSCLVGSSVTTTDVRIAGIAATQIVSAQSAGSGLVNISAWQARVPEGETGAVFVTSSGNSSRQHVTLYRGEGLTIESFVGQGATNAQTVSLPITTTADGAVLAVAANNNGAVFSWSGIDKLFDVNIANSGRHVSSALTSTTTAGALTVTATHPDNAQVAGVAVAVS